jgi:hypothetical protein
MDKGNRDAHKYKYGGGINAVETQKWGRKTAAERYGQPQHLHGAPKATGSPFPKDPEGRPGARNFNDTANDWRRGAGESAEGKPGYVKGYRGK